jgi:glycosyltransferase involved in cell wall biosynthesis
MLFENKRILIIHFRVGKTDGVSIEIDAWKDILTKNGAEVRLCAGPESLNSDFVIYHLEQQHNPLIYKIDNESFGGLKEYKNEDELINDIRNVQNELEKDFEDIISEYSPTNIIISNIFSVGEGLPVAGAFLKVLDKFQIPTVLVHHDFYWEAARYKKPTCKFIKEQLDLAFPPSRSYIKHYCINSIGKESLFRFKGLSAGINYDTFDYNQPLWQKCHRVTKYLRSKGIKENDLVVLQATRVVRRKNIELAIDLVDSLNKRNDELRGRLYSGKNFNPKEDEIVLLLSGYVERRDKEYLHMLREYADDKGVKLVYLGDDIDKEYTLFEIYPYADIITYPSEYEGFGNQFLEAVFARKPVVLFEYPVFKTDIMNKGFSYLSFGDKVTRKGSLCKVESRKMKSLTNEVLKVLKSSEVYKAIVDQNVSIAKKHFSYEQTMRVFKEMFEDDKTVDMNKIKDVMVGI